jgi:hypothetical protein
MPKRGTYMDDWTLAVLHETDPVRARQFVRDEIDANPYDDWIGSHGVPDTEPTLVYWRTIPGCSDECGGGHKWHWHSAEKGKRGAFPVIVWEFE